MEESAPVPRRKGRPPRRYRQVDADIYAVIPSSPAMALGEIMQASPGWSRAAVAQALARMVEAGYLARRREPMGEFGLSRWLHWRTDKPPALLPLPPPSPLDPSDTSANSPGDLQNSPGDPSDSADSDPSSCLLQTSVADNASVHSVLAKNGMPKFDSMVAVGITVDAATHGRILRASREEGQSVSKWIRTVVKHELARIDHIEAKRLLREAGGRKGIKAADAEEEA